MKKPIEGVLEHGLEYYIDRLESERFGFLRFGDSELTVASTDRGWTDRWNTVFFADMQKRLNQTVEDPNPDIYYGVCRYFMGRRRDVARQMDWFMASRLMIPSWVRMNVFQDALVAGELWPFIRYLQTHRWGLVGPPHLSRMFSVLQPDWFVGVPPVNAWTKYSTATSAAQAHAKKWDTELICFCMGIPATIAVYDLWNKVPDTVSLIDTGALFDPIAGVMSRTPFRKTDWKTVMPLNFGKGK